MPDKEQQDKAAQAETVVKNEAVQTGEKADIAEETPDDPKKQKKKKPLGREILEWVLTIVIALLIALTIRTFVFEPVEVNGASMNDTLANGERMFVTKFDYSTCWFTLPWMSDEQKENCAKLRVGGNPQRFDVIICHYPGRGDTNFVKRVVGLPGDTVALVDGYLVVNGEVYEEPYISDEYRTFGGSNGMFFGPVKVPEDHYFVMGDHRNNSNDSRSVGPISRDAIVGHVRSVVWPLNKIRGVK